MTELMHSAIANVIVSVLLGKRFDYEDPIFKRLVSMINENMKLFASPSVSVIDLVECFSSKSCTTQSGNSASTPDH